MFRKQRRRMAQSLTSEAIDATDTILAQSLVVAQEDQNRWWNMALLPGEIVRAKRHGPPVTRYAQRMPLTSIAWLSLGDRYGQKWTMLDFRGDSPYRLRPRRTGDIFAVDLLSILVEMPAAIVEIKTDKGLAQLTYRPVRPGSLAGWSASGNTPNVFDNQSPNEAAMRAATDYWRALSGEQLANVEFFSVPSQYDLDYAISSWMDYHLAPGEAEEGCLCSADGLPACVAIADNIVYFMRLDRQRPDCPPLLARATPRSVTIESNSDGFILGVPGLPHPYILPASSGQALIERMRHAASKGSEK